MTDQQNPATPAAEQMDGASLDIAAINRAQLKALFPAAFTETRNDKGELVESVDFERLKAELGTFTDLFESRRERYGMDWPGKKDALKLIQTPTYATLKPARDESVNFDTTENLFIEGDNLEVLKLLQKSYYGKVKMIYIDPPYNTGNEFIYPDNFAESLDTYLEYAGLSDATGKIFSTNTTGEGRFHTKWLNMMYPRLYLARNLLRDDGLIFISIDDNEVNNLRRLCDDVFGEDNFQSLITVQSNKRGQTYKDIAKTHEYLMVYAKSEAAEIGEVDKSGADLQFEDSAGKYDLWELRNRNPKFGKHNRPNLYFPIYVSPTLVDESGHNRVALEKSELYPLTVLPKNSEGAESCWRWGKDKISSEGLAKTLPTVVAKQKRDGEWNVYQKSRKSTTKIKSIWDETAFISEQGTVQLGQLGLAGIFDHPKPVGLVKKAIQVATSGDEVVLDFFAGSATSAQAVIELNREDSGRRKFILVQLPERLEADSAAKKAGFHSIADIGKDRIRRVIAQDSGVLLSSDQDDGFRCFRLDKSNFKRWAKLEAATTTTDDISAQLELHVEHIDGTTKPEDLLFELLIKSGFTPTEKVTVQKLAGIDVYSVADGGLLICLADKITRDLIDAVAAAEPLQFVCLDSAFAGNDQLKANAVQTFAARNQGRDKTSQIVFRTV